MTFSKREDGRDFEDTRPMEAKVGVIPRADGSAYFKIGDTEAYAAVYGPRNLYPRFLQNPQRGVLRCFYNMMPFSGSGDRVRPGANRRAKEISMVTANSLLPALDLTDFPNAGIDVFIEFPQTDAGSRCAGITAAAMALADAGIKMRDLVAAVAVGRVSDKILADLDYSEESYECKEGVADIPFAMMPCSEQITLLQMDGEIDKKDFMEGLEMAKRVMKKINEVQVKALKDKFNVKE